MKKIDLYEIAIKILGLYLVVVVINQLRDFLVHITVYIQQRNNAEMLNGFDLTPAFLVTVFGFLALLIFSIVMIFMTKPIAKFICRKTDFEEDVKLFAERKTVFEISLVLLGLIMVVPTLPEVLFKLKNYITAKSHALENENDTIFLITSALEIGIGLVVIIYSGELATSLSKKSPATEQDSVH